MTLSARLRNSITYNGDTAARRADLGEAIAGAANGIVTADAKAEFERAVALDPRKSRPAISLVLRLSRMAVTPTLRTSGAQCWRMRWLTRPGGRWYKARCSVSAWSRPKLSDEDMAAAKSMSEGDRNTMIRGMVERLATRLKDNGEDVEGWLRLVRAYTVLGEHDKAQAALGEARQAVGKDAARLQQLNDGLKNLGLDWRWIDFIY